jgi:hypothetical protein
MEQQNRILVLAGGDDPQLAMLKALPHVVGSEPAAFVEAAKDATVILNWSSSPELLRSVFTMCGNLRWLHSKSVGLDTLLFPELVESDGHCQLKEV